MVEFHSSALNTILHIINWLKLKRSPIGNMGLSKIQLILISSYLFHWICKANDLFPASLKDYLFLSYMKIEVRKSRIWNSSVWKIEMDLSWSIQTMVKTQGNKSGIVKFQINHIC
jgi:hypothetical protein